MGHRLGGRAQATRGPRGGNVRTVAIPFPACPGSHVRRWSARTAQPSEADATSNPSSRSRARRAATWA
jgi:hypothetical protein